MADEVEITAGSGTKIAADDVSSVFYQKVKLDGGGDGASVPIEAGGGHEADALRVTIANDSTGVLSVDDNGGSLTVDGTVAVTNADLTTIAGAVSGTHVQVDVLSTASHAVTGTVTAELSATDNAVLDVIAAAVKDEGGAVTSGVLIQGDDGTDRTNVLVDAAGHLQVDAVTLPAVVLGAGTAEIGKLAAGSASIGTVVLGAGTAEVGKLAAGTASIGKLTDDQKVDVNKIGGASPQVSNGTHTGALRVCIASDSSMPSQAVTNAGTFAVQAAQATAASLNMTEANSGAIKTAVELIDNAISGSEMQVDVVTIPDVVVVGHDAHDAAVAGAPVGIGGKALAVGSATTDVAAGDAVSLLATPGGRLYVECAHPNQWTSSVHDHNTAQTAHALKAADGALSHYVTDIIISNGATAGTVEVHDTDRTFTTGDIYLAANGGAVINLRVPFKGAAAHAIEFTSVTVTTHTVTINGYTAA